MHNLAQKLLRCFTALLAVGLVTACAQQQPPAPPALSFSQYPVLNMNVARIEVVEAYKSPNAAPNIEHLMPSSPAKAMKLWVKERLRATGSDKMLQVTIVDAPVISSDLPRTKGVAGLFTVDQDKKYEARLEVEMRIYGEGSLSEADTSVIVSRSTTIPENATVNSRRIAYEKLIADMMEMLNDKLEKNMLKYFGAYIGAAGKQQSGF